VDGNKRTGYIAGMTFLRVNGYLDLNAGLNDPQFGVWLEQVVSREIAFDEFVRRLRSRLVPE
jgi:prophage maintenance system killer protein